MPTIGERLKEERERLGYSQPALGALGGKTKKTVLQWESGEQFPNAAFLSAIAGHGADVQYILTGVRSTQALHQDEQELIEHWRAAPLAGKAAAIAALTAGTEPKRPERGAEISITGRGNIASQIGNGNVLTQTNHGENDGGSKPRGNKRRR